MRILLLVSLLGGLAAFAAFAAAPSTAPLVNKLIDQLGDDDEDVRKAAEAKLGDSARTSCPPSAGPPSRHADVDARLRAGVLAAAIEKKLFGEIRQYDGHKGWVYRMVGDARRQEDRHPGRSPARLRPAERARRGRPTRASGAGDCPPRATARRSWPAAMTAPSAFMTPNRERFSRSPRKHTGKMWVAALSPDGKVAVTGGMDKGCTRGTPRAASCCGRSWTSRTGALCGVRRGRQDDRGGALQR